jgi:uncharacterized membrane protein (UPF0127 family)
MRIPWKITGSTILATIVIVVAFRMLVSADDCADSRHRMSEMAVQEISLLNVFGKIIPIQSHIADNDNKRAAGYQNICEQLIQDTTILFVYKSEGRGKFHMRNVLAPLDIGFFDKQGLLLRTLHMKPYGDGEEPLYDPGIPFQYALEAREGFFTDLKLSQGKARLVILSVNDST